MADDPRTTHESPPPDLRFGAAVVSDGGRHGVISDLVPDVPGVPGGVRVTWDDGTIALVPRDAIAIEGERIVVHTGDTDDARRPAHTTEASESRSAAATTGDAPALRADEGLVVPIIEEKITAAATWREAGAVTFRVRTAEERRTVTARPAREELDVEEVAVGRELAEGERVEVRTEGDTTIIPVVAEEPVVVMRRMLIKELRVTKRRATEERQFEATVRRTVVETDTGGLAERVHRHGTDAAMEESDAGDGSCSLAVKSLGRSTLLRTAVGFTKEFLMNVAAIFPQWRGLRILRTVPYADHLTLVARTTARTASCPLCHQPACSIHSRYQRRVADLPCGGRPVTLVIHARRFFCRTPVD